MEFLSLGLGVTRIDAVFHPPFAQARFDKYSWARTLPIQLPSVWLLTDPASRSRRKGPSVELHMSSSTCRSWFIRMSDWSPPPYLFYQHSPHQISVPGPARHILSAQKLVQVPTYIYRLVTATRMPTCLHIYELASCMRAWRRSHTPCVYTYTHTYIYIHMHACVYVYTHAQDADVQVALIFMFTVLCT